MATTSITTDRSTAQQTTRRPDAPAAALPEMSPEFQRLLAQRELFGRLAEAQRSHHGQTETTDTLDALVNLLTDELEDRYPDLWEPIEPELLVTELGLFHDPADGLARDCSICQENKRRRTPYRRQPHRRSTRPSRPLHTAEEAA